MRKAMVLMVPAVLLAAAAPASFTEQEKEAHRQWMDDAQDRKEELREAIDKRDASAIRHAASQLVELALREQQFWSRSSSPRAKQAAAATVALAKKLQATDAGGQELRRAFDRLEVSCRSCHDQHFEKLSDYQ